MIHQQQPPEYEYRPELQRCVIKETNATVQWGSYRRWLYWFDIRRNGSRCAILRGRPTRRVLATGLIECTRGGVPFLRYDSPDMQRQTGITRVMHVMLDAYEAMRDALPPESP